MTSADICRLRKTENSILYIKCSFCSITLFLNIYIFVIKHNIKGPFLTPLFLSIHALMEGIESVDVVLFSLLSIQCIFCFVFCSYSQICQCVAWLIKMVSCGFVSVLVLDVATMIC